MLENCIIKYIKEINELFEFIKTVDEKHYNCIKKFNKVM